MTHNYHKFANTDVQGNNLLPKETWTRDIAQLSVLCNYDPECKGFNTNGLLKTSITTTISFPNITLYVKMMI